jgi:hypothetical protein
VLFLNDPPGVTKDTRRSMLDTIERINRIKHTSFGDPEIETRIAQYEMAYRMQTSVPELMDLTKEPESTFENYGPESRKPGTYAANCLLARRLAERGVRFIQLYHRGWDQHNDLPRDLRLQCQGTDQPTGGHPGRLGRRVRPDGLLPGAADGIELRARSSSEKLRDVGRGRRDQSGRADRRDRRIQL